MKLEDIEGIGRAYATKLRDAGIRSVDGLLERGATLKGRKEIAEATGFAQKAILEWVNRADLSRVRGVSTQYADLLEAVGVDSPAELARRKASSLAKAFADANANAKKRIVRAVPSETVVAKWIESAKGLGKVVKH